MPQSGSSVTLTLEHVARYVDPRFSPECLSELAPAVHQATEWQSLHDGQRYRQPGGAPAGSPRRRPVAPRSLSRCHCQRVAGDARRSDCAARRSSRPVGTRSARSGCGGRARVHGLGGRRRAPAESRICQARAGSDGPPRTPALVGCRGCRLAAAGPSGRPDTRASHRPPTGSGMRSMPTSSHSRRRCFDNSGSSSASAASATSPSATSPAVPPEFFASLRRRTLIGIAARARAAAKITTCRGWNYLLERLYFWNG